MNLLSVRSCLWKVVHILTVLAPILENQESLDMDYDYERVFVFVDVSFGRGIDIFIRSTSMVINDFCVSSVPPGPLVLMFPQNA